jgi:AcrR family transcriptional regulator
MADILTDPGQPAVSKADAIRAATLRLVARRGLHDTPISAIAREAGVAVGTAYLYFESKEALINALYLELVGDRDRASSEGADAEIPPRERLWRAWSSYARWHLENRDASNFIQQCEASGILTEETRSREIEMHEAGVASFAEAVRRRLLRDLPLQVFYALFMGPVLVLAQMQERQEIEITGDLLRLTFEGVARSVLSEPEVTG